MPSDAASPPLFRSVAPKQKQLRRPPTPRDVLFTLRGRLLISKKTHIHTRLTKQNTNTQSGAGDLCRAFTHASHQGPVRAVDAAGGFVVSGGNDDQLHVYDVKKGRDLGFLVNPGEGAVPCVQLFTPAGAAAPSHMFSGSADGGLAIWKAGGDWEHLKMMRGHKGAVNAIAVHPSGRLALSVARDASLRMWDLLRGRCTYTAALGGAKHEGLDVSFGPRGDCYCLLTQAAATLHDAGGGGGGLVARADFEETRLTAALRARQDER